MSPRRRYRRLAVVGYVWLTKWEAQENAVTLRIAYPRPQHQVHIFQRGIRAGGYVFTVWAVVVQRVRPVDGAK